MKKYVLPALIIMMIAVYVLSSCNNSKKQNDTNAPTITETNAATEGATVKIVANNIAVYSIIRPENAENEFLNIANKFYTQLKEISGSTNMTYSDDWYNQREEFDFNKCEILIGFTNRSESAQALTETPPDGFTIKHIGNKIVIVAHNAVKLNEAVEYFFRNSVELQTENNENTLLYKGDYTSPVSDTEFLFDNINEIAEYKVVYASDLSNYTNAQKFQKAVKNKFNIEIKAVPDSEAESEKEIIIGNTNRKTDDIISQSSGAASIGEYIFASSKNKLLITAYNNEAVSLAVEIFKDKYILSDYSNTITFTAETTEKGGAYYGDDTSLADGADLRIMSWNILAELWNTAATLPGRDVRVCGAILAFQPDVIGLQEVSEKWYPILQSGIGEAYNIVYQKNTNGANNYTSLAYNTKTVKLLHQDMIYFSQGNSTQLRVVCWGLFERLSDGKEFIVMNTHWDPNLSGVSHASQRLSQSREHAELAKRLASEYNVPIFSTGDYNCGEDSNEFKQFIDLTGFADPKYSAEIISRPIKTYHTLGEDASSSKISIDHIAVSNDVELLYYNTLIDKSIINASDHCPIYIDVKLK